MSQLDPARTRALWKAQGEQGYAGKGTCRGCGCDAFLIGRKRTSMRCLECFTVEAEKLAKRAARRMRKLARQAAAA